LVGKSARTLGLAIAAVIFILDQLMKYIVTGPLGLTFEGQQIEILPFFDLTLVWNKGVSLGMLQAETPAMQWLLIALLAGISLFVLRWLWKETNRGDVVGLGLVLGGAMGNLIDRVRFGHVIDYADLHFGSFRPFLVFNVADACITIGVLILLARALLVREKKPDTAETNHA